jgi:AraC-like DNA-binding protein
MGHNNARNFMQETLLSGYRHHSYALEKEWSILQQDGFDPASVADYLSLETYADILAPNRLRAMKNSLICFIAVISRSAISYGVDPEKSFSISDYYINEVEQQNTAAALQTTLTNIVAEYQHLVAQAQKEVCSLPVSRALEYIRQHIYGPCNVTDIAHSVGYNPQYLATIFKAEVGHPPIEHIRMLKMQEAKELLLNQNYSVAEISQSLGFCNTSYFIREFKRTCDVTPARFRKITK